MKTANRPLYSLLLAVSFVMGLSACGQEQQEASDTESTDQAAGESPADVTSVEPTEEEAYAQDMPVGAKVFFVTPKDGAEVSSPVKVVFGIEGMKVAPAGTQTPETGHHHLLVDVEELPDLGQPIPADDNHIHFGKGQTEVELELEPGEHTLQLLFADGNHVPHDPPVMSDPITITVVEQE